MKNYSILIVFLFATITLAACTFGFTNVHPSRNIITEERELGSFNKVNASGMGEVDITQGDQIALTIEADEAVMPYLTSEIQGETLELGIEDGVSITGTATIKYHLTVTTLSGVTLSGLMEVHTGPLTSDNMELTISGSGNMDIETLTAQDLQVVISGMGELIIAGEITGQDIHISGMGEMRAGDLRSQIAEITVSGAGDITMWVSDSLDVHVSGAADINYYGSPQITQEISGAGSIHSLGDK